MRLFRTIDVTPTLDDIPNPTREDADGPGTELFSPAGKIGQILVGTGKLDASKVPQILRMQEKRGLRFGEAALKLRLIKPQDLMLALSRQFAHPCLQPGEGNLSHEVVAAYQHLPVQVEALRQQRTLLTQHWFSRYPALAILSPGAREGRSYLTANLAVVFAQLGRRILLIDADLRRPRQHDIFNIGNRLGLSSFLAGRVGLEVIQSVPALPMLSVLTAGPMPPNPQEILERGGMTQLLEEAYRNYQVILIDTPPGNSYGDAQIVARYCRGALVVLRQHHTRVNEARALIEGLNDADVKVVGTVMNQF